MKGNNYILTDAKNIQTTNSPKTVEYGNPAAQKNGGRKGKCLTSCVDFLK